MPLNILKILIFILLARRIRPYCALHTVYPGSLNKFHRVNYHNNWQKSSFQRTLIAQTVTHTFTCELACHSAKASPLMSLFMKLFGEISFFRFSLFQELQTGAHSYVSWQKFFVCLILCFVMKSKQILFIECLPLLNKNMLLQEIVAMPFY